MRRSPASLFAISLASMLAVIMTASCALSSIPIVPTQDFAYTVTAIPSSPAGVSPLPSSTPKATTPPVDTTVPPNDNTPGVTNTVKSNQADPVLLAAGDIAVCGLNGDEATARLLDSLQGTIITLGDNAYPSGSPSDFAKCYGSTWGHLKGRTRPAPGNHEYGTAGASGYFDYFGAAAGPAGKGYYSYDIGAWHVISLNSEIASGAGSTQEKWLRADLAAHRTACALAYWHQPRFSSGPHGDNRAYQPLWQALYDGGAEIVLNGHDHDYERFAPQDPGGSSDAKRGIREFVVGTGGATLYPFVRNSPNTETRNNTTWGVLELTLHAGSYDWRFLPIAGRTFSDSGSAECH